MFCIENSYRFQIPFPDKAEPVEQQIFSRYRQSIVLRLRLITQLRAQGKLDTQTVTQEIQILQAQLQQTRQELGLVG